jgi:low affinity Fe/Cu permease
MSSVMPATERRASDPRFVQDHLQPSINYPYKHGSNLPLVLARHLVECAHRQKVSTVSEKANNEPPSGFACLFGDVANKTSQLTGRTTTIIVAAAVVIIWALTGRLLGHVAACHNTGTTIVTFLMVYLIQNSQNRDSAAIHVKLDELIRTSAAHNSVVGIEDLTRGIRGYPDQVRGTGCRREA